MTQTFTSSTTWSIVHNLGTDYPQVTVWDTNRKVIVPTEVHSIDTNNVEIYFNVATAGTVNISKGGHFISGSVPLSNVYNLGYSASFTNLDTWSVVHNLGTQYPLVTVWNNSNDVVVPSRINASDTNTVVVYFSSLQTGTVIVGRVI